MVYDDGFVACLNGTEVARDNMGTTSPAVPTELKASNADDDL